MKHYVYVISDQQNRCKIGYARNPKSRLSDIQVGNADELHIDFAQPCASKSRAQMMERYLHCILKRFKTRGEWFSVDPKIVRFEIKKLCVANRKKKIRLEDIKKMESSRD